MNIVVVEDNPLLLANFVEMLERLPGHRVTGSHASAENALAKLKPGDADLLITDLNLPGISGIELIRLVKEEPLNLDALAWTVHEDSEIVYAALKAGAVGYLLKGCDLLEMENVLRELEAGGAPMSPSIARRLLTDMFSKDDPDTEDDLSIRERNILRGISKGFSRKELADQFGLSPHTIHAHLRNIYRKLHVKGRSEALAKAKKRGILINW